MHALLRSGAVLIMLPLLAGCQLVGGMVENYRKDSTHKVEAEYIGLAGKSFAVVVQADRAIQGEHPGLVEFLSSRIADRLADPANSPAAAGFVSPADVASYQARNPSWAGKAPSELAKDLGGVSRLVMIEMIEYRLNEPGNPYEWDGVAAAIVSVVEVDSPAPDEPSFSRTMTVKFPGKKGFGPDQMSRQTVTSALAGRLVDRVSWLFYAHEEPYYPEY